MEISLWCKRNETITLAEHKLVDSPLVFAIRLAGRVVNVPNRPCRAEDQTLLHVVEVFQILKLYFLEAERPSNPAECAFPAVPPANQSDVH